MRVFLFIILFLLTSSFAESQNQLKIDPFRYIERIYGNPTKITNLPIVFALHYMGSTPCEFEKLFNDIDFPVTIIYVAGEYTFENGYSFYPVEYYDSMTDEEKGLFQEKIVEKVNSFVTEYKKQVNNYSPSIVIGVSQGGDLSYLLALYYPDQFVLSVPIAASIQKEEIRAAHCKIKNQHIYPFHGTLDKIVPISEARDTYEYIKTKGFNITFLEFENKGHEVSIEMKEKYKSLIKEYILLNNKPPAY